MGAYFGEDVDGIVARLLAEQLEDGGWNCEAENGSVRSSFDTTINVLEGLLAHERLQFSYPPQWHYDVLRALDYFRTATDTPDDRVGEAIALVRDKQQPDGTWLLENTHPGDVHLALECGDGRPSRWNSLRALRVLRWHDAPSSGAASSPADPAPGTTTS